MPTRSTWDSLRSLLSADSLQAEGSVEGAGLPEAAGVQAAAVPDPVEPVLEGVFMEEEVGGRLLEGALPSEIDGEQRPILFVQTGEALFQVELPCRRRHAAQQQLQAHGLIDPVVPAWLQTLQHQPDSLAPNQRAALVTGSSCRLELASPNSSPQSHLKLPPAYPKIEWAQFPQRLLPGQDGK